ncbi:RxLR effector protein [Phytophthora megakarya]|uniref:RxLR effector protein n=1 Tax=Phytophthora megakarya TaxID=4795 RepID=A0A225W4F5_9STRA|nr:RxLR effector protein [Phytophthora megakarya]
MRLVYNIMTAVFLLSVHQVPVTASVGSDIALTGVMSLGFWHLVDAGQKETDHARFLRRNHNIEGEKEDRGFADVVEQLMAKILVNKMVRTNSFSALEKVDDLGTLRKISDEAHHHMTSAFKAADQKKMSPRDLAIEMEKISGADNAIIVKAIKKYTMYLRGLGKEP